ncbi:MAG: YedE-related selenium metabolism membrane protein [Sphaerochaetaceae bacterium]|nr:YedE-related selenium metabolism membrane protein [Sphaerochaetaceae bacterium]
MAISSEKRNLLIGGAIVGVISVALVVLGNPKNMGFCIACFIRDTAGAVGLHRAAVVQYARPEIIGLVLGAFLISLIKGEFKPRGGSSPMIRFALGAFMMVGALTFLGCPLRMIIRLAGGDLNALVGLAGFVCGIGCGCYFLNNGFSLGKSHNQGLGEGVTFPVLQALLLVVLLFVPSILIFSEKGPGSMRSPLFFALAAGLVVGVIAQRIRMCMAGGVRDIILFRDFTLICGPLAIFVTILIGNIAMGSFKLGFAGQPVASPDGVWNFLGMLLCGLCAALLGGCPLRQLILAGEGNTDSAMACLGMLVGAAFAHNWGLASSGDGSTAHGHVAVIFGLIAVVVLAVIQMKRKEA